jgi:hypothetical protein
LLPTYRKNYILEYVRLRLTKNCLIIRTLMGHSRTLS